MGDRFKKWGTENMKANLFKCLYITDMLQWWESSVFPAEEAANSPVISTWTLVNNVTDVKTWKHGWWCYRAQINSCPILQIVSLLQGFTITEVIMFSSCVLLLVCVCITQGGGGQEVNSYYLVYFVFFRCWWCCLTKKRSSFCFL